MNQSGAASTAPVFQSPTSPLLADCVAKLFVALRERNNRIRVNASLNQYCVSAFVLESMLLDLVVKIVLQHNRHFASIQTCSFNGRYWRHSGHHRIVVRDGSVANDPKMG